MKTILAVLLLFPALALAADECCFKGPGKCSAVNSESEKLACEKLPFFVVLDSACREAPECMLSEEDPVKRPDDTAKKLWKPASAK